MKPSGAVVLFPSSLYLSFSPLFEIFLHTMPNESPQSWNACCHLLRLCKRDRILLETFLPFLFIFAAPTLLLAALDPYQKESM